MKTTASLPRYSVVIPTLQEAGQISQLLNRLRQQTWPPDEILVVDGGSRDTTVTEAKSWKKVRVLRTHPPVAHQRNLGGQTAVADLLIFMDADVYPEPDFCQKAIEEFVLRHCDCACPWTHPYRSNAVIAGIFWFFNSLFWLLQWFQASGGGMCLLINRELFIKSHGFKTSLKFEDIEFIRRISRRARFRILNTPLAVSDRRFRQDGTLLTALKYLLLGVFFSLGFFRLANLFSYHFGHYHHPQKRRL